MERSGRRDGREGTRGRSRKCYASSVPDEKSPDEKPPPWPVLSGADYEERRGQARAKAADELRAKNPQAIGILDSAGELVCHRTFAVSGQDLTGLKQGQLLHRLLVSFCRTHMLVTDLVRHCELVDAVVLLRKQMELVARIYEIEAVDDATHLEGKTPNIKACLAPLRRMYGEYSAVAHSAKEGPLSLLGDQLEGDDAETVVFPVYNHNAVAVAQHLGLVSLDFLAATRPMCKALQVDISVTEQLGADWILMACSDLQ